MIAHMVGEIDFCGLDLAVSFLAQFDRAPAAFIRRGAAERSQFRSMESCL
jgi:hypothetical protein